MTYLGSGTFGGPVVDTSPTGALADLRTRIALALDVDPDVAVHAGYVDAVAPPAYLLASADPWLLPATPCVYTARLAVVCVACRLDPAPGLDDLERLVERALVNLTAARGVPIVQVGGAGPFEVGGIQYLASRITVAAPVTIGA